MKYKGGIVAGQLRQVVSVSIKHNIFKVLQINNFILIALSGKWVECGMVLLVPGLDLYKNLLHLLKSIYSFPTLCSCTDLLSKS